MVAPKRTPVTSRVCPDFRELLHGGYPANAANLALCLEWVFEDLTDAQREQFFESLEASWCFRCGKRIDKEHPGCPWD